MLIQINSQIVVMVLDLILVENIIYLTVANVKMLLFLVYTSSYVNIDNKGKVILILGKGPTRLNQSLTAETQHSVNFTKHGIKFCLSLHYNGSDSFTFVNATQIYQAKAKDSEMKKIFFAFRKYFRRFFS